MLHTVEGGSFCGDLIAAMSNMMTWLNSRSFFNCEWHVKPWTSSLPGSRFFPRSVDAAA
jgi:hypothetical protein